MDNALVADAGESSPANIRKYYRGLLREIYFTLRGGGPPSGYGDNYDIYDRMIRCVDLIERELPILER